MKVSAASTVAINIFIFIVWGPPEYIFDAMAWVLMGSVVIFLVSLVFARIRYSVKLKVFRGIIDDRIFLSLRGVGKGTWIQIPAESIISCKETAYRSPIKGLFQLLTSSCAPYRHDDSSIDIYPLPGYEGSGIFIEYKVTNNCLHDAVVNLLIPTNNPALLCDAIMLGKNRRE